MERSVSSRCFGVAALGWSCALSADHSLPRVEQLLPSGEREPPKLTWAEHVRACVILAGCAQTSTGENALDAGDLLRRCASEPSDSEMARIPLRESTAHPMPWVANERWALVARAFHEPLTCVDALHVLSPPDPRIVCDETGCQWDGASPPIVRCRGSVAQLLARDGPSERDCARSFQECDPKSATGCTDRVPYDCDPAVVGRCDGNMAIECGPLRKVTVADCNRMEGGICSASPSHALCSFQRPTACVNADAHCQEDTITLCTPGGPVTLDCKSVGLTTCVESASGPICAGPR